MDTILGLFGMAIWITGTISIAAGITYLVVKIDERLKASRSRT